jgi:hypothetical protein
LLKACRRMASSWGVHCTEKSMFEGGSLQA